MALYTGKSTRSSVQSEPILATAKEFKKMASALTQSEED
jgi:hypothetical protein